MERIVEDFQKHLQKDKTIRNAAEYVDTADKFVHYLINLSSDGDWTELLQDEALAIEFTKDEWGNLKPETQKNRQQMLQSFRDFVKTYGGVRVAATRLEWFKNHPWVVMIGAIIAGIILITDLTTAFFNWTPYKAILVLFPTDTPTPTLTPTTTPLPSATATSSPTITPTPNSTELAWSRLLSTPNPGFTLKMRQTDNGSEQVWVPAGYFVAGDQFGIGFDDEIPHVVFTDGFWIDKFLVTNAQFANCPEEVCERPAETTSHKRPNGYFGVPAYNNFPVMEVTWSQAYSYCEWLGGRLPTEAEWEKAAGWDPISSKTFIYPWGNQEPHKGLANYDNVDLDTSAVDAYPEGVSPVGAYDMAGNVWQWVSDWYAPYSGDELLNPTGPDSGEKRIVRGGSWSNDTGPRFLRVANRGVNNPAHSNNETGFRCVFDE